MFLFYFSWVLFWSRRQCFQPCIIPQLESALPPSRMDRYFSLSLSQFLSHPISSLLLIQTGTQRLPHIFPGYLQQAPWTLRPNEKEDCRCYRLWSLGQQFIFSSPPLVLSSLPSDFPPLETGDREDEQLLCLLLWIIHARLPSGWLGNIIGLI